MTAVVAGPYEADIPRNSAPPEGYRTAEQELAEALEGQAPHLAHELSLDLGPLRTAKLAQTIRRAVAVGIRRRATQETADRLTGLQDLLFEGLNQMTADCEAPEPDERDYVAEWLEETGGNLP